MRLDVIQCDRCGCREHPNAGNIAQAIIKLHRVGRHAAIDTTSDLCENCFETVLAAINTAMEG